jgi:hypothetical protein
MTMIHDFINWVFAPRSPSTLEADENYLSASVDMLDLERRMREIDRRRPIGPFGLNA